MTRTRQQRKPKSRTTYLPEYARFWASKNYPKETAEGPYWEPFIDWADQENPKISWMTDEPSLSDPEATE